MNTSQPGSLFILWPADKIFDSFFSGMDADLKVELIEGAMEKAREALEKQLAEEKAKTRASEQRVVALLDEIEKLKMRLELVICMTSQNPAISRNH